MCFEKPSRCGYRLRVSNIQVWHWCNNTCMVSGCSLGPTTTCVFFFHVTVYIQSQERSTCMILKSEPTSIRSSTIQAIYTSRDIYGTIQCCKCASTDSCKTDTSCLPTLHMACDSSSSSTPTAANGIRTLGIRMYKSVFTLVNTYVTIRQSQQRPPTRCRDE